MCAIDAKCCLSEIKRKIFVRATVSTAPRPKMSSTPPRSAAQRLRKTSSTSPCFRSYSPGYFRTCSGGFTARTAFIPNISKTPPPQFFSSRSNVGRCAQQQQQQQLRSSTGMLPRCDEALEVTACGGGSGVTCPLCLDEIKMSDDHVTFGCMGQTSGSRPHRVHCTPCFYLWLSSIDLGRPATCPICRDERRSLDVMRPGGVHALSGCVTLLQWPESSSLPMLSACVDQASGQRTPSPMIVE